MLVNVALTVRASGAGSLWLDDAALCSAPAVAGAMAVTGVTSKLPAGGSASLSTSSVCKAPERQQLLNNPGLESPYRDVRANGGNVSGRVATGWYDNTDWVGHGVLLQYIQDTSAALQGSSSQRINIAASGSSGGSNSWRTAGFTAAAADSGVAADTGGSGSGGGSGGGNVGTGSSSIGSGGARLAQFAQYMKLGPGR